MLKCFVVIFISLPWFSIIQGRMPLLWNEVYKEFLYKLLKLAHATPSAVRCPLSAYRYPLTAVRYPLTAYRLPLSAYRCPLSAICYPLTAVRISLSVYRCPYTALRLLLSGVSLPLFHILFWSTVYFLLCGKEGVWELILDSAWLPHMNYFFTSPDMIIFVDSNQSINHGS